MRGKQSLNRIWDPYVITAAKINGIVRAYRGKVTDTFNICNLTLCKK